MSLCWKTARLTQIGSIPRPCPGATTPPKEEYVCQKSRVVYYPQLTELRGLPTMGSGNPDSHH